MRLFSSLRSRIFVASALLAVLCIGVAIYLVNVRVTAEAERTLEREIVSASALVDNLRTTRTETFMQMARFIADAPPLKAAVDTNDPPTVQAIADRYQNQVKSNLLLGSRTCCSSPTRPAVCWPPSARRDARRRLFPASRRSTTRWADVKASASFRSPRG